MPIGVLAASAWVALTIVVVFGVPFVGSAAVDCSGALASNYACYQDLVKDSGVGVAFDDIKDEYEKNDFVKSGCHQLVHVIGRSAAEIHGDLPTTYAQGDEFRGSGYYHGDEQAKRLCESVKEADLRTVCFRAGEEYYEAFEK